MLPTYYLTLLSLEKIEDSVLTLVMRCWSSSNHRQTTWLKGRFFWITVRKWQTSFFLPFWRGGSCPWGCFTVVIVVFLKSLVMCQFCPEFISTASHGMRSHGWTVLLLQLWQHVDMKKFELALCRLINFTCSWRSVYSFLLCALSHLPWISILKVRETAL